MSNQEEILIYVVDDEESIRKDLHKRLGFRNIKAVCFASAEEALAELKSLPRDNFPTAILVDYVMKGKVEGKELVSNLLKHYPQLPIIIISGIDMQGSIQAYAMGAYAVMQKPIDYNELEYTVRELAKRNRQATQIAEDMLNITEFDSVLVWELDWQDYPNYKVTGSVGIGVDKDFIARARLSVEGYPRLSRLEKGKIIYYQNVAFEEDYRHHDDAQKRGWTSLLAFPFFLYGRMVGWIDCYSKKEFIFRTDESYEHKTGYLRDFTRLAGENLQSQRLREQFRIIHETSQNLSGTLQENLIYESILTKALEITNADCGWIYCYEADKKHIVLTAKAGGGADKVSPIQLLNEKKGGISGKVAATGKSLYVPDVTQPQEDTYDPEREYILVPGVVEQSVLAVPLRRGERTLGVLTVNSKHLDFFIPDDLQFLTGLAAVAAVGMERQKLAHHLEEMSRMAQTAIRFDDLAVYVINAVRDLTDATVNLWLLSDKDKEGDEYLRLSHSTLSQKDKKNYDRISIESGSSYSAKALEEGRHIVISDLNELSDEERKLFKNWDTQQKKQWRSLLVVPLVGKKKERLGVLSLLHTSINKFSDDDGTLIQHFANQAALALQEQWHLAILQKLTRISQELTTTLSDTKAYLTQVVELAKQISKASLVVIYPYDHKRELFYAAEFNVWAGKMLHPKDKLTEKPRRNGLTALIRAQQSIRVEDISPNEPFRFYAGAINEQREHKPGSLLYQETVRFITGSGFISREEVQSFIGVSLIAKEAGKAEEVAVMYFNYRSPRYFTAEELQVIDIFCNQVANVIHRNRLFNALAEERKLIEGVNAAALEILQEKDQRKRLNKIVKEAVGLLHAKGGKVYLTINGSQQDLRLVAKKNLKQMQIGQELYNEAGKGKGIALEVVRSGLPRRVKDYPNYENHIPELAQVFSAVVEVPLLLRNKVIGVLGVFDDKDTREFTEADERVLMQFAAQAALAVYNARLYDELDGLYKAGLEIAQNASLQDVANRILTGLQQVIFFTRATIQRIDGLDDVREVIAYKGGETAPGKEPELTRSPREDALILPIIESKKPKIISNTRECEDWDGYLEATKYIQSWAGIPLVFDGKVLGLLILDHTTPGYYTDDDLPLLERFALQAAIGMNNALIEEGHLKEIKEFSDLVQKDNLTVFETIKEFDSKIHGIIARAEQDVFFFNKNDFFSEALFSSCYNIKPLQPSEIDAIKSYNDRAFIDTENSLLIPLNIKQNIIGIIGISYKTKPNKKDTSYVYIMLSLLERGLEKIAIQIQRMNAIKKRFNPYITGDIVKSSTDFFGRENVLNRIANMLHNNHFIITGERRIGKSSVLHQLKNILITWEDEEYCFIPIYIDYEATKGSQVWRHTIERIREGVGYEMISRRRTKYDFDAFCNELDDVLNHLSTSINKKEFRLVLLMDEVDVFKKFRRDIMSKIRKILQDEDRIKTVMAGVSIRPLVEDITSSLYNMLNLIPLDALTKDEARMLITHPVSQKYVFENEAIDKILEQSQCKPLAIQKLCSSAVENMLNRLNLKSDLDISQNDMVIFSYDVDDQFISSQKDKS